jgi:hypothetical protein
MKCVFLIRWRNINEPLYPGIGYEYSAHHEYVCKFCMKELLKAVRNDETFGEI